MNGGSDLRIIADILKELKKRWPGGLNEANLPNVRSFLSFKLKQIQGFDRQRFIDNFIEAGKVS